MKTYKQVLVTLGLYIFSVAVIAGLFALLGAVIDKPSSNSQARKVRSLHSCMTYTTTSVTNGIATVISDEYPWHWPYQNTKWKAVVQVDAYAIGDYVSGVRFTVRGDHRGIYVPNGISIDDLKMVQ